MASHLRKHRLAEPVPALKPWERAALKRSLREHGQIDPIITYEGDILDGWNRYELLRELGADTWFDPFAGDDDAARALVLARLCTRTQTEAERAKTRDDVLALPLSQRVAVAEQVETDETEKAERRMKAGQPSGNLPQGPDKGRAKDKAASAAGMSRRTYEKAKEVVKEGAPQDVAEMDATGKVDPVHKKVRERKKAETNGKHEEPAEPADELGIAIPAMLRETFAAREQYGELHSLIRKMQGILNTIAQAPGGEFLQQRLSCRQTDGKPYFRATQLIELSSELKGSEPYAAVCPFCQSQGGKPARTCKGCQGRGWVSVMAWKQASEDVQRLTLSRNGVQA